jgi:hypothetical protein
MGMEIILPDFSEFPQPHRKIFNKSGIIFPFFIMAQIPSRLCAKTVLRSRMMRHFERLGELFPFMLSCAALMMEKVISYALVLFLPEFLAR